MSRRPIVGVTSNRTVDDGVHRDWLRLKYVEALVEVAECIPVILTTVDIGCDLTWLLERLDGVLLTGDESDIQPQLYGQRNLRPDGSLDPYRDALVLPLIRLSVSEGVPLFGICRGMQEINVAFGGTLYQNVAEQPGHINHQEDLSLPRQEQYLPVHRVKIDREGIFAKWFRKDRLDVNSLHGQGVWKVAPNLRIEAVCEEDGLIEAVSVIESPSLAFGVQWHPEWYAKDDKESAELFKRFGDACREASSSRIGCVR